PRDGGAKGGAGRKAERLAGAVDDVLEGERGKLLENGHRVDLLTLKRPTRSGRRSRPGRFSLAGHGSRILAEGQRLRKKGSFGPCRSQGTLLEQGVAGKDPPQAVQRGQRQPVRLRKARHAALEVSS